MSELQKLKDKLKKKDKEIAELKELLAEAETEIKELNDFHGFQKPRASILESRFLNKMIKTTAFVLVAALIVIVGIFPWIFSDDIIGDKKLPENKSAEISPDLNQDEESAMPNEINNENQNNKDKEAERADTDNVNQQEQTPKQMLVVASDLGWLNVRTEPSVENGKIIKKIDSGAEYEWLEHTDNNWYKIVIDGEGHTGFVSGEYIELK